MNRGWRWSLFRVYVLLRQPLSLSLSPLGAIHTTSTMKSIVCSFVCVLCSATLCLAEPPSSSPAPTGLRDIASSEFDRLTLEIDPSTPKSFSIHFYAFGSHYVLRSQYFPFGENPLLAPELIAQFRAAKSISVKASPADSKDAIGYPELVVERIQFHY